MNNGLVLDFSRWVDRIMREHVARPAVAYNFNLYEHEEEFAIQLIGATAFDPSDDDWACDEAFSSGEDLFILPHSVVGRDWRNGLRESKGLIESYLEQGKEAGPLKASRGVGVGFVGGDLKFVYLRRDP
jgi:hypothetical protein